MRIAIIRFGRIAKQRGAVFRPLGGATIAACGRREEGRARGPKVIDVGHDASVVIDAVRGRVDHGRYPSDTLYGDGHSGERIASMLAEDDPAGVVLASQQTAVGI